MIGRLWILPLCVPLFSLLGESGDTVQKVAEQPNIALLPINWRGLKVRYQQKDVIYHRPGFESHQHKLATHKLDQLISQRDLAHIQATPRIVKPEVLQASTQLADLEHHAIASLLNHPSENLVNLYWDPRYCNYLLANLPLMSEFRKSMAELEVVCVPDEDSHWGFGFYRAQKRDEETLSALPEIQYEPIQQDKHAVVQPWLAAALDTVLSDLAEQLNVVSPEWIAPLIFAHLYHNMMENWIGTITKSMDFGEEDVVVQ